MTHFLRSFGNILLKVFFQKFGKGEILVKLLVLVLFCYCLCLKDYLTINGTTNQQRNMDVFFFFVVKIYFIWSLDVKWFVFVSRKLRIMWVGLY